MDPRFDRSHRLLGNTRDDHNRNLGCPSAKLLEPLQTPAVREVEVQEHDLNPPFENTIKPRDESLSRLQAEGTSLSLGEHFPDEDRIVRIVLDEERPHRRAAGQPLPAGRRTT